mgnify:CR=1 FL=1
MIRLKENNTVVQQTIAHSSKLEEGRSKNHVGLDKGRMLMEHQEVGR